MGLGVSSGSLWLVAATVSSDVAACEERWGVLSAPVTEATAASGTVFRTDFDLELEFPAASGWPSPLSVDASGCSADCSADDCID